MTLHARLDDVGPVQHAGRHNLQAPVRSSFLPLGCIALVLVLQFTLVLGRAINWDEFFHYNRIEALAHGTLTLPLQTLYARVFLWVLDLPGTGIDHIIVIRVFMFLCELVVLAAITGIARRFVSLPVALLCALSYVSAGFVFQHGFSFRFDPPTAALLMVALWVVLRSRLEVRAMLAVGLLVGLAFMMTIKSALYAPAFAGLLWLRWCELGTRPAYLARIAFTGGWAVVVFILVYLLHSRGLGAVSDMQARNIVGHAAGSMFRFDNLPYLVFVPKAMVLAPMLTLLILMTPWMLAKGSLALAERIALLGLFAPIATLFFYHNTAPYYYTFMLAPVAVACAPAVNWLVGRYGIALMTAALLVFGIMVYRLEPPSVLDTQRRVIAAARAMFPQPVSYFDFCAMLDKFPKANVFMTPWVSAQYRAGKSPSMREIMAATTVPLVINNDPMFEAVFKTRNDVPIFLPEDVAAMRTNYVHFWGPFWIAGQEIAADGVDREFDLLVPGPYTVSGGSLVLDGRRLEAGDVVDVARGIHSARAVGGSPVRLVWGRNIRPPSEPSPEGELYAVF